MLAGTLTTLHLISSCGSCCRYAPGQNLSSAELYVAARKAVDSLGTYATMVQPRVPSAVSIQPDVQSMNSNIQQFLAAAQGVPVTVCPVNCLNMGSFYGKESGACQGCPKLCIQQDSQMPVYCTCRHSQAYKQLCLQ